jgi:hypothetical protein
LRPSEFAAWRASPQTSEQARDREHILAGKVFKTRSIAIAALQAAAVKGAVSDPRTSLRAHGPDA